MATTVSSALVRTWVLRALEALGDERAEIDALNVFPVPDGDTGTNLFLTFEATWESVEACWNVGPVEPGLEDVARALTSGALMGARGNSGVIMSQILRGTGEVLSGLLDGSELSGPAVRDLLRRGADLSYQAVARPVEGTILTVARAAADAAQARVEAGAQDAAEVLAAATAGAREALDRTPDMLESLRLAGVVDAGGRGLVVVLDALAEAATGVRRPDRPTGGPRPDRRPVPDADAPASPETGHAPGYTGPAYEVMYLLEADDVTELRAQLDGLGDSLVVVGGEGLWNVHVHVHDAGAAIEAGMRAGRPYRIRVTYLQGVPDAEPRSDVRGIVAVAHGPGVATLLEGLGVTIVPAVPRRRPSTAELLGAIHQSHADEVIVLPSDKDTRAVAEAAAEQARAGGLRVSVIPTRAVVQTLAAVAVHDPASRFDDAVVAMTRAAGATRYGAVTIASRRALTTAGACEAGDVLGLVDGDIVLVGAEVEQTVRDLLSGMLAIGGELVTLVWGVDAGADLRAGLTAWIEERFPLVEVTEFDGGQPLWPLIVGVE